MAPAIAISSVSYRYPGSASAALEDVSLEVAPGKVVGLLGPNGCGKSTLLKLVAQIDRPASGRIEVADAASASAVRARLGVVFQTPSLDPRMTVRENLGAYAAMSGLGRSGSERIGDLLDALGVADRANQRVGTLSLGLARRVDLCRALLHGPSILLLDEPTVGLDPPSRERFLLAVDDVRRRDGTTVLMSTHIVDEADRCDRVAMMHRGRVALEGAPRELRSGLGSRLLTVTDGERPPDLAGVASEAWARRSHGWTAPLPERERLTGVLEELLRREAPFSVAPPTLADLFAVVTGQELSAGDPGASPSTPRHRRRREASHGR